MTCLNVVLLNQNIVTFPFIITFRNSFCAALREKGLNLMPARVNNPRHETNLKAMETDGKSIPSKGFLTTHTSVPITFSTILRHVESLAPRFDELKVKFG